MLLKQPIARLGPTRSVDVGDRPHADRLEHLVLLDDGLAATVGQASLAAWEQVAHENPDVAELQNCLASSLKNLGLFYERTGNTEDAFDAYARAIEIRDGVVRNPTILSFQGREETYPHRPRGGAPRGRR